MKKHSIHGLVVLGFAVIIVGCSGGGSTSSQMQVPVPQFKCRMLNGEQVMDKGTLTQCCEKTGKKGYKPISPPPSGCPSTPGGTTTLDGLGGGDLANRFSADALDNAGRNVSDLKSNMLSDGKGEKPGQAATATDTVPKGNPATGNKPGDLLNPLAGLDTKGSGSKDSGGGGGAGGGAASAGLKTEGTKPSALEDGPSKGAGEDLAGADGKYVSGGGGGGGGGSRGGDSGGLGSLFGNNNEGTGGAGQGGVGFGKGPAQTDQTATNDPEDYFTRISTFDSIFKVVEKRYKSTATDWAVGDAKSK